MQYIAQDRPFSLWEKLNLWLLESSAFHFYFLYIVLPFWNWNIHKYLFDSTEYGAFR